MEIIFVMIPLGIVLAGLAIWAFFWAVGSGQFDDLDGPAYSVLLDDDQPSSPKVPTDKHE
ncbi:MAG TPA: cbb3-type cytochrome oxidase assembly protein CcoS [Gammaproteobacteria bacterium]|nr:cbb3-type cytochrome oxidase assembly protein CcoS [Gammaproteobacteria bacterium]